MGLWVQVDCCVCLCVQYVCVPCVWKANMLISHMICTRQLKQEVERKLDNEQRFVSLLCLMYLLPYSVEYLHTIHAAFCALNAFMFFVKYLLDIVFSFPFCLLHYVLRAGWGYLCCQAHFRWNIVKAAMFRSNYLVGMT